MPQDGLTMAALFQASADFVEQYMHRYDSSHDYQHVRRVVRLANHIARAEASRTGRQLDMDVVRLAALLHDVGDAKYATAGDASDPVRRFLVSVGASDQLAEAVQMIVDRVSYSKERKDAEGMERVLEKYPELGVVQDADRLDALGAIGIGRCFTYGASVDERQRIQGTAANGDDGHASSTDSGMERCLAHFDDKLLLLHDMMKTPSGKQLARQRTQRLLIFQTWWNDEQDGSLEC